jgi:hypothetical protein
MSDDAPEIIECHAGVSTGYPGTGYTNLSGSESKMSAEAPARTAAGFREKNKPPIIANLENPLYDFQTTSLACRLLKGISP